MAKRFDHKPANPEGIRATLENKFGAIDFKAFNTALDDAIENQRQLDRQLKLYAEEGNRWSTLATELRHRKSMFRQGLAHVAGEVKDSTLDEPIALMLRDRLGYLLQVVEPALVIRIQAANCVAWFARIGTGKGRPAKSIVDACLNLLVNQLVNRRSRPLPKEKALQYVAALARSKGVLPVDAADAGAALRARLKRFHRRDDRDPLTRLTAGKLAILRAQLALIHVHEWPSPNLSLAEVCKQLGEIASGDWPDNLLYKPVEPPTPTRRMYTDAGAERFYRFEASMVDSLRGRGQRS